MEKTETISVEVAYARPDEQVIFKLDVPVETTIRQAIELSGVLQRFPDIDIETAKTGVFGKLKKATQTLRAGDRVEIYRALIADPKEVRKQRAAQGKKMKKGGS